MSYQTGLSMYISLLYVDKLLVTHTGHRRQTLQCPKEDRQTLQCPKEDGQTLQCPKEKGKALIYKTLHGKLKFDTNPNKNRG